MKNCLNCGIEIGGNVKTCPLCQNALVGEASVDNWPPLEKLKKRAFFYKLQLFIVLASIVICLSLDYLLELNGESSRHWSMIFSVCAITVEIVVTGFVKRSVVVAKILSMSVLHVSLILLFVSWYYNFMGLVVYVVIPFLMCATLIANLVFSLIDKTSNAMVYLLANILVGVLAYAVIMAGHKSNTLPWTICLMCSMVTLIGIIIFKGKKVISEIQKRMNF